MRLSHVVWNLGGLTLPLGVAALTVPHLIETLGHERFGLLALAWGLIGYAGAMDLGIGRALTRTIARLQGEKRVQDIPDVLRTGGRITLVSGLVGSVIIALVATLGGATWIGVSDTPLSEIVAAMLLLAVALPAQAMSATYRGTNEAFLNFKGISVLRAALGIVNFAGPYLVSLYSVQLPWLVATLVASRLLALFIYRALALRCLTKAGGNWAGSRYSTNIARKLFSFGGWVTVSSVVSPILVQADRFVIASVVSAAAVSVYVLPYEVVVQSLVVVGAVSSVIFPVLSRLIQESPMDWRPYFNKWLLRIGALMLVICLCMAMLLPLVLPMWIRDNLHPDSILIGQVLCLGVFANTLGAMYYAVAHARGRADITAKLHLLELPLYLGALVSCIAVWGVVGAAWAWSGRMIFDAALLSRLSR